VPGAASKKSTVIVGFNASRLLPEAVAAEFAFVAEMAMLQ